MKMIMKKTITFLVVAVMLLPLFAVETNAASSVIISTKDHIDGGDTFSVTVTYDGSNIGRVSGGLNYDTDKLAYVSGGEAEGNSGYVHLSLAGTGEAITFNIKFQAIAEGQTSLSVETYEMYDLDERYISETPFASKSINISGNAAAEDIIEHETSPDAPVDATELIGVDEMEEGGLNINLILIIAAAVAVALIVIVSVILSKNKKKKPVHRENKHHTPAYKEDRYWMEDVMGSGNMDRKRDYSKTARHQAKEETQVFDDWQINDDEYNDIDKW